jgi:hypothetical protein
VPARTRRGATIARVAQPAQMSVGPWRLVRRVLGRSASEPATVRDGPPPCLFIAPDVPGASKVRALLSTRHPTPTVPCQRSIPVGADGRGLPLGVEIGVLEDGQDDTCREAAAFEVPSRCGPTNMPPGAPRQRSSGCLQLVPGTLENAGYCGFRNLAVDASTLELGPHSARTEALPAQRARSHLERESPIVEPAMPLEVFQRLLDYRFSETPRLELPDQLGSEVRALRQQAQCLVATGLHRLAGQDYPPRRSRCGPGSVLVDFEG